jgi:glyoxylase-like metal-dependent hydrolase (beta-lactamase superfamily II)
VSDDTARALQSWRGGLHRGERTLAEFAEASGLRWNGAAVAYLSHWLTPLGRAKRFDTRFFIAEAPAQQVALHDGIEMMAHRWMRPADALAEGELLKLMGPTRATLQGLSRFASCAEAMAWARSPREVPRMFPRIATGAAGARPVMPGEFAWAEIGKLDPRGRGDARYDLVPGQPVRLSERVWRVTAGNAGVMTGPGTNTYLVADAEGEGWAVIDPGPLDEAHVQAVIAAAAGPITRILVTHTHSDHSPAAALLKARTGAITLGRVAAYPDRQDASFVPDVALAGGERLALGPSTLLRVIHTPGHASNHLCYLLEQEKLLFTGDHVMQASTVVINPPDGDMTAYLGSLRGLLREEMAHVDWLAPGHGFLMERPQRALEWIVAHREQREAKVLDALHALGLSREDVLLARVYDDVPVAMHGVAARSLLAHLLKLRDEGRAHEHDGHWALG